MPGPLRVVDESHQFRAAIEILAHGSPLTFAQVRSPVLPWSLLRSGFFETGLFGVYAASPFYWALGRSIRSGVRLYVQGHPEFFQPFFRRWPVKTLSGSSTVSPSMPSVML